MVGVPGGPPAKRRCRPMIRPRPPATSVASVHDGRTRVAAAASETTIDPPPPEAKASVCRWGATRRPADPRADRAGGCAASTNQPPPPARVRTTGHTARRSRFGPGSGWLRARSRATPTAGMGDSPASPVTQGLLRLLRHTARRPSRCHHEPSPGQSCRMAPRAPPSCVGGARAAPSGRGRLSWCHGVPRARRCKVLPAAQVRMSAK